MGSGFAEKGRCSRTQFCKVSKERLKGKRDIGDARHLPETNPQSLAAWFLLWQLESLRNVLAGGMWEHFKVKVSRPKSPICELDDPGQITLPLWASEPFSNENKITYLAGLLWLLSEVIHVQMLYQWESTMHIRKIRVQANRQTNVLLKTMLYF